MYCLKSQAILCHGRHNPHVTGDIGITHDREHMPNSQRQLDAMERTKQALELRLAGFTYTQIAEKLGYSSRPAAFKAVMNAMKRTLREPAEKVRELELDRLDELLKGLWFYRSRVDYTDRILKIMERRSKLLGLDAPERVQKVLNPEEEMLARLTDDERAARIAAILDQARERRAGSSTP